MIFEYFWRCSKRNAGPGLAVTVTVARAATCKACGPVCTGDVQTWDSNVQHMHNYMSNMKKRHLKYTIFFFNIHR